jgi:hypothetical protein
MVNSALAAELSEGDKNPATASRHYRFRTLRVHRSALAALEKMLPREPVTRNFKQDCGDIAQPSPSPADINVCAAIFKQPTCAWIARGIAAAALGLNVSSIVARPLISRQMPAILL